MNESYLKIALAMCILVILALVIVNYVDLDKDDNYYPDINEGLTSIMEFDVNCPEVGSSTKGTFFTMQSEESIKIKMVADLIVGETDTGGIEFAITRDLDVTNILCSFNDDVSTEYVHFTKSPIFTDGQKWTERNYIQIAGISSVLDPPRGGGEGTVIIELELNESVKLSDIDSLDLYIAVGGKRIGPNSYIQGLEIERMSIPILKNITK